MHWITERIRKWWEGEYTYPDNITGIANHKRHWTSSAAHWVHRYQKSITSVLGLIVTILTIAVSLAQFFL